MEQYISKSAVLAEIDKVMAEEMNFYETACKEGDEEVSSSPMVYTRLQILRSFINTLEVKDVDLEEKATLLSQKYFPDEENIWARPNIEAHKCKSACIEMVEWFKAQKGK